MNCASCFLFLTLSFALATQASNIRRDSSTLIVGGRPALQGEAPYQLSLRTAGVGKHLCGASLAEINGIQIAVTAAHCIRNENFPFILVAGDVNKTDVTGIEQFRSVNKMFVHQNFSLYPIKDDIALLIFNKSFELNENVSTIPLPMRGQVTSDGSLKVSGWGTLEYLGTSPDLLQIAKIPVVNDTECQKAYEDYPWKVDDNMICAESVKGDMSPCYEDSGGPAISDAGYLAGIVSWAHKCGHPDYPVVFTKVANYVDWMQTRVKDYLNGPLN